MITLSALRILAQVSATPAEHSTGEGFGNGMQVLDYLKYGTLGLAGIILWLAFILFRQANGLDPDRMEIAQKGVDAYMKVAKWLLIPCLILQILGLILPYVFPPQRIKEAVSAWIRMPPLQKGDDVRYGGVGFKIRHWGIETPSKDLIDEEIPIRIEDHDIIVVNVKDIVDRLNRLSKDEKEASVALEPTKLHQ